MGRRPDPERVAMIRIRSLLPVAAAALAACGGAPAPEIVQVGLDSLPAATATFDESRGELVLEMNPIDIPAGSADHEGMIVTPIQRVDVPVTGFVSGFRVEAVDANGTILPIARLHHLNVIDPGRRELFAPIALRLLAASKETGSPSVNPMLVGMPLWEGQRLLIKAMLHNPEPQVLPGVKARVVFTFRKGGGPTPFFHAYAWQLDTKFPVGGDGGIKSFDLPPGRSETSYEAQPAVSGTLVGIGGHVHDFAKYLEFTDATTGEVIWRGEPILDSLGGVKEMPVQRFYRWNRMGVPIDRSHTYRVTVVYDNPTGQTIPFGGMGVVAGLFLPARGTRWPGVDTTNADYRADLANQLMDGNSVGEMAMMHSHHVHQPAAGEEEEHDDDAAAAHRH